MGGLNQADARSAGAQFDRMIEDAHQVLTPTVGDFALAKRYVENFATQLRAGDALHLAIAKNWGMEALYTLDETLLKAGKLLKIPVSRGIR